jgi:hypothetical protein
MARRPGEAQRDVLARLLHRNRDTRFGVKHRFSDIADPSRFRVQVPVQDYETLRPYIDEQRRTGVRALTAESPLFYAQTSGTTGKPKHIPITRSVLETQRDEQALFSYLQYRVCPQAFAGRAFGIMGAAVEGYLDSGHAFGSVSGHLYQSLPRAIRSGFVVPPEVSSIAAYDLKYLIMLRLALAQPDITYIGSPNPATFLRLLDILNAQRDLLRDSLATGRLAALDQLEAPVRRAIEQRLAPNPGRAALLDCREPLTFADLWPRIALVTTWTGGSCGIALGSLRPKLPSAAVVMELGYQSSEFRGTMALEPETPSGLPPIHHHYFEFVEQAAWDNGDRQVLTLDQLEVAARYYVIITTAGGLYRYFMNDLVEVTGFFHRTPLFRFVQKGKGVTSLMGEKLYEAQAIEAVQQAGRRLGVSSSFFLLVADEATASYRLFIEPDAGSRPDAAVAAAEVDDRLGELNVEYHSKRWSGRLRPLTVAWLERGTAEAYKGACVKAGQREGQFKVAVLQYRKDLVMSLDDHVVHP